MLYAKENTIISSKTPVEGAIEITPEQYHSALRVISEGGRVSVVDGFLVLISKDNIEKSNNPLTALEAARKQQEDIGVTIDQVRYSGSQVNRQLLNEAIQFATTNNITVFPIWKDSDNVYHPDHPVTAVQDALNAIGIRRSHLIGVEATYAAQISAGASVDIDAIDWS